MSILSYQTIKRYCRSGDRTDMVFPCVEKTVFKGKSFGLSESGYDMRIKQAITLYPRTLPNLLVNWLYSLAGLSAPRPHFVLASTAEHFNLPQNVMFRVCDKSTWIRQGLHVHNTVAECSWSGFLTIELSCVGNDRIDIPAGVGIAQAVFEFLDEPSKRPYRGKYNRQPDRPVGAIQEDNFDPYSGVTIP